MVSMEKHGTVYNYSFCNSTQNGQYIVNGIGDVDGIQTAFAYDFIVNPLGKTFTSSQAVMYCLIFVISFVLFLICLIAGIYTPSGNKTDEMTGYVLAVSNLKYIKILMFCFSYLLLVLMTYFGWMVSYGYLDMDFLGNLFNFAFWTLVIMLLPLFIVGSYVLVANLIKDSQVADTLQRGIRSR
jgi:magnesium-transporting ATPase (P-type)